MGRSALARIYGDKFQYKARIVDKFHCLHLDAKEELEQIDAEGRHVPQVLEVRLAIYSALKKWELMETVAKRLALYDPDNVQWRIS